MSMNDGHDERIPRTVYFQTAIEDLKERVAKLEINLEVNELRGQIDHLQKQLWLVCGDLCDASCGACSREDAYDFSVHKENCYYRKVVGEAQITSWQKLLGGE